MGSWGAAPSPAGTTRSWGSAPNPAKNFFEKKFLDFKKLYKLSL
jgi:hypothetical protein